MLSTQRKKFKASLFLLALSGMILAPAINGVAFAAESQMKQDAKQFLAPHALMIDSNLQAALAGVKGLRSQIEVVPNIDSPESLSHIQAYQREIRDDLAVASAHQQELEAAVKRFPNLASSDEFRSMSIALNNVKQSSPLNARTPDYWTNHEQAKTDLSQLQKGLEKAIDQTNRFNSKGLDINTELG